MPKRKFGSGHAGGAAQVSSSLVLGAPVVERLAVLVDLGALVSVSRARDGGAVAVTVTWDGEWERHWFRDQAECVLILDEVVGIIEDLAADRDGPPAANQDRRKRPSGRR